MKEDLINRKIYKKVKKMDRQEMEAFLADIYHRGYQDGAESANGKGDGNMKCKDEVSKMCMKAIKYKKYAEVRDCEKCCLFCEGKCDQVCDKALEEEG